jgi:hypothetical protein
MEGGGSYAVVQQLVTFSVVWTKWFISIVPYKAGMPCLDHHVAHVIISSFSTSNSLQNKGFSCF